MVRSNLGPVELDNEGTANNGLRHARSLNRKNGLVLCSSGDQLEARLVGLPDYCQTGKRRGRADLRATKHNDSLTNKVGGHGTGVGPKSIIFQP